MSGVVKSIGKVFSKVWDFIKPIAKPVLIAAAVYFTAGLALSAFPATASFAASLPGFAGGGFLGLGVGSGAVAGTGIFSHVAAAIGLGGGLASGAASLTSAAAAAAPTIAGATTLGEGASIGAMAAEAAATAAPIAATSALAPVAAKVGMSITDKLLLASVGTNLVSGLTAPTPRDIAQAKAAFYGSFYGMNADGSKAPPVTLDKPATAAKPTGATVSPAPTVPGVNIAGQQAQAAYQAGAPEAGSQVAQQQRLIPDIPYSGQPLAGSTPDFAVQGQTPLSQPRLIS